MFAFCVQVPQCGPAQWAAEVDSKSQQNSLIERKEYFSALFR